MEDSSVGPINPNINSSVTPSQATQSQATSASQGAAHANSANDASGGGKRYHILGMDFNQEQYQAFLQNEAKIMMTCMKEQEARMKRANEELKKSILGEE
jgi:hypothetical protein